MHRFFHLGEGALQFLGDAGHAAARQALQCGLGDRQRQRLARRVVAEHRQLQLQALAQRAGGHADGVEALHLVQHDKDVLFRGLDLRQQGLGDPGQGFAQVAVVFQRVDQCGADAAVARGEVRQVQLPQQVAVQRIGFGHALGGAAAVVVVERASAAGRCPGPFVRRPVVGFAGGCALVVLFVLGQRALVSRVFSRRGRVVGTARRARVLAGFAPVQQGVGFHRLGQLDLEFGG